MNRSRRPTVEVLEDRCLLTTYVVNTTRDILHDSTAGQVTLRDVLTAINTQAASGQAAAGTASNTIHFAIGASGSIQTIRPSSALPTLVHQAVLDGWSQGGASYSGPPLIVLNGLSAGGAANGLTLGPGSDGSTVRGLVIQQFTGAGIEVRGAANNLIEGNYLGTNTSGSAKVGTMPAGIEIDVGATGNTIGGVTAGSANLIAVDGPGVEIKDSGTSGNSVLGNLIGTNKAGTAYLGALAGVEIRQQATGNTVGGTASGAANLIDANGPGVEIKDSGTSGNSVLGNLIGTNKAGTAYLGALAGVEIRQQATGNTIGGTASGSANVIDANGPGVEIMDSGTSGNTVLGDFIGTNKSGTAYLQALAGVEIRGGATANTVGGTAAGSSNVIDANGPGVEMKDSGTAGNTVLGNLIGTNASGSAYLEALAGVEIRQQATGNTVGGTASGSANVIDANGPGVEIMDSGTSGNTVLGNLIGTNSAGSVYLGALTGVEIRAGATANTVGGTATGAANVIDANGPGVEIKDPGTSSNVLLGNLIGTDVSGTRKLGTLAGVEIRAGAIGNTVGGTAAGSANVISGSSGPGVEIKDRGTSGNTVLGNLIGTTTSGTAPLGNVVGIEIRAQATGNTIGGTAAGAANVISANGLGVEIKDGGTSGNVVLGNRIGTDLSGTIHLGNTGDGVLLHAGASSNTIGGTVAGSGNTIAFNAKGVVIVDSTTTGDRILGNSIFGNLGQGIDLGNDGPTANGVNPRPFPNNGQNTPDPDGSYRQQCRGDAAQPPLDRLSAGILRHTHRRHERPGEDLPGVPQRADQRRRGRELHGSRVGDSPGISRDSDGDRLDVGGYVRVLCVSQFLNAGGNQNRKYRCAIGNTFAGSQVSNSPSAHTR